MSDAAFQTAPFAGYTTEHLRAVVAHVGADVATRNKMRAEIARRDRVAAGDLADATPGERLRAAKARA